MDDFRHFLHKIVQFPDFVLRKGTQKCTILYTFRGFGRREIRLDKKVAVFLKKNRLFRKKSGKTASKTSFGRFGARGRVFTLAANYR